MVDISIIQNYIPEIEKEKLEQFRALLPLYSELNQKINVISRKDMDNFYIHHVLHSLALTKFCDFSESKSLLDIGTGGGFPAIPLAIMYPQIEIIACDSIGKKIGVVNEVASNLGLKNIQGVHSRVEQLPQRFDTIVARAVAQVSELWKWSLGLWSNPKNPQMFLLKGGDVSEEFLLLTARYPKLKVEYFNISEALQESFFETKKVIRVHY